MQPAPDDLVEVKIDDELVIAAPRGYDEEVREVIAATSRRSRTSTMNSLWLISEPACWPP